MIQRAVTWALRSGMRKGVVGGSGPWLVVAVAAGVFKLVTRPPKGAGSSTTLNLRPGDRYSVVCSEE
ncbi:MAG: hypothetical protein Q8K63_01175 [Acidimicrobiales bacterium]|nr:hypothetical protein [Acidimicrobiales bacterium]